LIQGLVRLFTDFLELETGLEINPFIRT